MLFRILYVFIWFHLIAIFKERRTSPAVRWLVMMVVVVVLFLLGWIGLGRKDIIEHWLKVKKN